MQMLNVTALITGYETVGDHTEFITQISCNGGLWLISRRFSDFDQLHSRLQRSFGDLIESRIPEKQWFGRFDPNFLAKRQAALQEYLDGLFQVPGILEDRSLQHFLELEKHLELNGDMSAIGSNGNSRSNHGIQNKSMTLNENDRLAAIVEHAAQTFIDISEVLEPLEADQAIQRKNEIVNASQSLNEQRLIEEFATSVNVHALVTPAVSKYNAEMLISRFETSVEDEVTYEQERHLLQSTLNQVEQSLHLTIRPSTLSLVAVMEGAAALNSAPSSAPASLEGGERESENFSGQQPISVN